MNAYCHTIAQYFGGSVKQIINLREKQVYDVVGRLAL